MNKSFYTDQSLFRFTEKSNNDNERANFELWFREQINLFGQEVDYHAYNYQLSGHDPLYGEYPTANYHDSVKVVMYLELTEESVLLSKFGLQGEDDVTAYISISSYKTSMSSVSVNGIAVDEPTAGDVFTLSEYGDDRTGGRGGKSFEITQRLDQQIATINPLAGHYVWLIQAKRLDYTFTPGVSAERKSEQVIDSNFAGILSGFTSPASPTKTITDDIDADAKSTFDYNETGDGDDVYGDYY